MYDGRYQVEMKGLLNAGLSKAEIARRLGVNRRTVTRWNADHERPPRKPRRHKLDPYKELIRTRLTAHPRLSAQRLFDEVRTLGYDGSYARVRDFVRGTRPGAEAPPTVRFETPPGHQAQVDFATIDTKMGRRHALLVVLGHSRLQWVGFYPRQTMAVVMDGLERAFAFFGGVPHELLFDQMKAVVTGDRRADGGDLLLNQAFQRFATHWGFRIRACRPYRAQTKGKVERQVRYLRDSFLYGREFLNDADLDEQLDRWLREVANVRIHGTLRESPQVRFERDERHCLRPLALRSYRTGAAPVRPSRVDRPVAVERRSLTAYAELVR